MVLSGLLYLNNNQNSCNQQKIERVVIELLYLNNIQNRLLYNQPGRTNVASVTPWLAPIIWEGTFDPILIDSIYKQQNLTIATTVFALGKYTRFVKDFLESAEQHYFVGF
ncbi:hypothetical protein cypCar_00037437 [Cyprinus carpio]|nr:hypothetical protein cypCar_00037437 [Cyprinus carpio]